MKLSPKFKLILLSSVLLEFAFCFLKPDQVSSSQKSNRIKPALVYTAATASPVHPAPKEAVKHQCQDVMKIVDPDSIFDAIAACAASCLLESDKRRNAKAEHSHHVPSSATNWINDENAFVLQNTIDRLKLKLAEERTSSDRDEASSWIRWMKSTPTPMIIDLSPELRMIANTTMSDADFDMIQQSRMQFLSRMGAKLILFPSGVALSHPLREPPASLVYGKLLFGGVTRYRRLNDVFPNLNACRVLIPKIVVFDWFV